MRGDDVLRETFAAYAEQAPRGGPDLPAAARGRAAARRRARLATGATGLATAAVVAGAFLVAPGGEPPLPPPVAGGSPADPPAVAPGMRAVSFHGLEAQVPAGWPRDGLGCGMNDEDTYLTWAGPVALCFRKEASDLTVAELRTAGWWESYRSELRGVVRTDTTVDGLAAERYTARTDDGRHVEAVVVRDVGAAVWVRTPRPELARTIVGSVRVVEVDRNGCAARITAAYGPFEPQRAGADRAMVPGEPVDVSLCRYFDDRWLGESARPGAAVTAELRDVLNGLKPGFTDPPPRENIDCTRYHEAEPYLLVFRYAGGGTHTVRMHMAGCRELGLNNGARTGRLNRAAMDLVSRTLPPTQGHWTHLGEDG